MRFHFSFAPILIFYTALYSACCIRRTKKTKQSETSDKSIIRAKQILKVVNNNTTKPLNIRQPNDLQGTTQIDVHNKTQIDPENETPSKKVHSQYTKPRTKNNQTYTPTEHRKPHIVNKKTAPSHKPSVNAQDLITKEVLNQLEQAYNHPADKLLSQIEGIELTQKDLISLKEGKLLNDNIINAYLSLIAKNSKGKVYAFSTFFFTKLSKEGYEGVSKWTKKSKTDIFSKDKVLIPIHLENPKPGHWCLAVIDNHEKTIKYYDSLGEDNKDGLEQLWKYLVAEMADKKKIELNRDEWRLECLKEIAQQGNGYDCGVFLCQFAKYVAEDCKINFTQSDMPYFRQCIAIEILNKKLM